MLFTRGGGEISVKLMMEQFHALSMETGLVANKAKCKVYFGGVRDVDRDRILQATGFSCGVLPFKYLGVPRISRKLTIHHLIDRIVVKIKH